MAPKIAIVTGSNKGIGYEVVKGLAHQFDGLIYLTSRDENRGQEAIVRAKQELGVTVGNKLRYHQLDIDSKGSIDRFRDFIASEHGRIDVLVNNAGMAFKASSPAPFAEQAKRTVETNFFGTLAVCHALLPLLAPGARVVNCASRGGTVAVAKLSSELRVSFGAVETEADVVKLIKAFVDLAQAGTHGEAGYPDSALGMSKLGVIAVSQVLGKALAKDASRPDIVLNAACPGHCATDMSSNQGNRSAATGADTIVYLATLPPKDASNPVAQFVGDRAVIDWRKGQTKEEAFGGSH